MAEKPITPYINVDLSEFERILDGDQMILSLPFEFNVNEIFMIRDEANNRHLWARAKETLRAYKANGRLFKTEFYLIRFELTGMINVDGITATMSEPSKSDIFSSKDSINLETFPHIHKTNGKGKIVKTFKLSSLDVNTKNVHVIES